LSKIALSGNASGTGTLTLSAPNTNTNQTLTLPDNSGTVITTASTGGVAQAMLASGVAGTGPAFSAYKSGNQTGVASSTFTKVTFGAEEFDTNSCFDTSTARFTPTVAGYYQFNWNLDVGGATTALNIADIYKNGVKQKRSNGISVSNGETYITGAAIIYMNGTTDYVELYVYISGSGATVYGGAIEYSWFQGFLARSAT